MPILDTCIIYNKANYFGIKEDVAVIESALKSVNTVLKGWTVSKLKHVDSKQPPTQCDIQIHMEMPVYANIPWAKVNILMVNPDHYVPDAYDAYLPRFSAVICKDSVTYERFKRVCEGTGTDVYRMDWICNAMSAGATLPPGPPKNGFVAFIGASSNKCDALLELLPHWHTYPLTVYTTRSDFEAKLRAIRPDIDIRCQELDEGEHQRLIRYYSGHVIVSHGEGFGHAAAKAYGAGAFMIMNVLPVFKDYYLDASGVGWILSRAESPLSPSIYPTLHPKIRLYDISAGLTAAFANYEAWIRPRDAELMNRYSVAREKFVSQWRKVIEDILAPGYTKGIRHLPPPFPLEECPPISVVTLTYNRRNFVDLCGYNLLLTDYPRNKIEWVVVEDSDDDSKAGSDKFVKFAADHPEFSLVYVPVGHRMSVGAKRNLGVERATNEICLFMDDDDFYPMTSFRRRVAWLTKSAAASGPYPPSAVGITTMALYDLKRAASAVNVPPWNIPLRQRISEASLCFKKSFWEEKKFPEETNIAEGDEWLRGRETAVLEIPSQHIIVALSHGSNISSRKVPAAAPVGCAWGWPEPLLRFLHGLVGVQLE
jgi:hypothetical protein